VRVRVRVRVRVVSACTLLSDCTSVLCIIWWG